MNLWQNIGKYIWSCTLCAIAKPSIKQKGLYTPFPTPSWPWESISMDYMSGLPYTKHDNDCVFMVVDRFSKMAIMAACKNNIIAEATAKLFFEQVWVHFGIPQSIISYQDSKLNARHQAHKVHNFPSPDWWPNRGCQSDDRTHFAYVQHKASMHMGWEPPLCIT